MNELWGNDLNKEQKMAVEAGDGPVLVIAGPGSGKTRVVACRILHLMTFRKVPPERILAMTFTNKAAGEMRSRLGKYSGRAVESLWLGTFHSVCARLLRMYGRKIGIPSNFVILDEDDQIKIIKEIIKDSFKGYLLPKPAIIKTSIERGKKSLAEGGQFVFHGAYVEEIKKIYSYYQQYLSSHKALDFGDLLIKTIEMLEENEEVRGIVVDRFIHVIVDEFQDTDLLQYRFLKIISSKHGNLFVVGDDDQSIYGWRGARVENILNFEKDFPQCEVIKLKNNYRSTAKILNAASSVIESNGRRKKKHLQSCAEEGEPVYYFRLNSEEDEAQFVVELIKDYIKEGGSYADCVVIYRVHAQSRPLEEALSEARIPYRIIGGTRFYERAEIKDVLAYLKTAIDPRCDLCFSRILNVPPRGVGHSTFSKIRKIATRDGISMFDAAEVVVEEKLVGARSLKNLSDFLKLIVELRETLRKRGLSSFIDYVMRVTSYEDYLKRQYFENYESRMENIKELKGRVEAIPVGGGEVDEKLNEFFDQVALQTSADELDSDGKRGAVTLMTAHCAKGLEFNFVIVVGVEDGLFPYRHTTFYKMSPAAQEREIEEECRLLYVGMTRAKKKLCLTYSGLRWLYGTESNFRDESPFLSGVPDGVIIKKSLYLNLQTGRFVHGDWEYPGQRQNGGGEGLREAVETGGIRVGDTVRHTRFGGGVVIGVSEGKVNKVKVVFENGLVKTIKENFLSRD